MKDARLIAFDLDGTLTDPASGLVKSFTYALTRMGIECEDEKLLRSFIGPPLHDEWMRIYHFSEAEVTRALSYFHEYFGTKGWCDNLLYPGIPEMLDRLRAAGKKLMVATSKPEIYTYRILDLFDLSRRFDFIAGAESEKTRDKKWEVLAYGLSHFPAVPRDRCVMVGDRKYDAEGAARVGIPAIGVTWGHGSMEELTACGFASLARSPEELVDMLI